MTKEPVVASNPVICAIRVSRFSAAHTFHNPSILDPEESRERFGKAARPHGHGHDYVLETAVSGPVDDDGMILNLSDLKAILQNEVVEPFDFRFLNHEVDFFKNHLPTSENILDYLWDRIAGRLPEPVALVRLSLSEGTSLTVSMDIKDMDKKDRAELKVTRKYDFCASHRLHNSTLSDEENRRLYGKCNNLSGHGHNYEVDVTVRGHRDPRLGTAVDLSVLDRVVQECVLEPLDHHNLNVDIEGLRETIPTSENIVHHIWNVLKSELGKAEITLHRVRLSETPRNSFEISEDDEAPR